MRQDITHSKKQPLVGILQITSNRRAHYQKLEDTTIHGQACLVPRVSQLDKLRELVRFALTRLRVVMLDPQKNRWSGHSSGPVSDNGLFNSLYVEPMFLWWGRNTRLLTSPSLGSVDVADSFGERQMRCVNGASHNYAGLYSATAQSEALHRACLDMLPVVFASDGQGEVLSKAVHSAIAEFWGADFCFTMATGYGSNYVALPPLLVDVDVVILDKDCHNSAFTGVFLGQSTGLQVRKFAHNDMIQLEGILKETRRGDKTRVMVIIEGCYSMEGDVPPLDVLHSLKQDYGFVLYCDEAHSFLSLGNTGRGCLEHWNDNHPHATPLPNDLIDLRSGTLSKAVGGIGGFITGKARFEACISRHIEQLKREPDGGGAASQIASLPTASMVQTLWVLYQPLRTQRNLARLSEMARFCRRELRRLGIFIYGSDGTPVLPVWTGRPCMSARFSFALRRHGVLASPVTTPAVPFWESRVRVNLSADFTDAQVHRLVSAIASAAISTGVIWKNKLDKGLLPPAPFESKCPLESESKTAESAEALTSILAMVKAAEISVISAQNNFSHRADIVAAGHASRGLYGVGSGSSRWISGTFPCHLAVETLLARATSTEAAMTYADASIGLASTVAALARPLKGRRRHIMLFPRNSSRFARDGLALLPPASQWRPRPEIWTCNNASHLLQQVRGIGGRDKHVCLTVYLELDGHGQQQQPPLGLAGLLGELAYAAGRIPITVLVNSFSLPPRNLFLDEEHESFLPTREVKILVPVKNMRLLVFGDCSSTVGLPVGYLAGPESLVRELRYTSRAYMYTTSTPPSVMDMLRAALAARESAGLAYDEVQCV